MVMYGLMTVSSLDQPLFNMTSRSVLPDTFLPKAIPSDLVLKDQANILGWLHPAESVNLERSHDQKSVAEEPSGNKVAGDMEFHVIDDPQEAYFKFKNFLSEEVPAELTKDNKDQQRIQAVVFLDFVALEIEVMIESWQDEQQSWCGTGHTVMWCACTAFMSSLKEVLRGKLNKFFKMGHFRTCGVNHSHRIHLMSLKLIGLTARPCVTEQKHF